MNSPDTSTDQDLLRHVLLPVADEEDARATATALEPYRPDHVTALHVVEKGGGVPDKTPVEQSESLADESYAAVREVFPDADDHTAYGRDVAGAIFEAARTHDADTVVMGWGPDSHGSPGRAESALDELATTLPADFLVVRDRGFDPDNVLIPTRGGPGSDYAASIASFIKDEYGSDVTLLHVADSASEGEEFLEEWAAERGLSDATLKVESGDVGEEIVRAARDASLLIVGASERGLLVRLVRGSPAQEIVDDVECSVILAEQQRNRSIVERLLGR